MCSRVIAFHSGNRLLYSENKVEEIRRVDVVLESIFAIVIHYLLEDPVRLVVGADGFMVVDFDELLFLLFFLFLIL